MRDGRTNTGAALYLATRGKKVGSLSMTLNARSVLRANKK